MSEAIRLKEGEAKTITITIRRNGSAIDLSSYTLTLDAWDKQSDEATLKIDGLTVTADGDQVTNKGKATVTFTTTHTTLGSGEDFAGFWQVKMTAGSDVEYTDDGEFFLHKNWAL